MRSAILLVEQSGVRLELKKQIEHVEEQQDDRRSVGQHEDVAGFIALGFALFVHHRIQRGGDDEGRRRYGHQRRHGGRHGRVEELLVVFDATGEEATAQDEQDVRQDRTQHARLHDADLSVLQCHDADLCAIPLAPSRKPWDCHSHDQFHGVAKGGIQQPS